LDIETHIWVGLSYPVAGRHRRHFFRGIRVGSSTGYTREGENRDDRLFPAQHLSKMSIPLVV